MLLALRKILFYLLAIIYVLWTPYIVFSALGYSFNAKQGEFLKTGLISIESEPKSATVYLQGKKYAHRTPTVLRDLVPGRYHLKLQRKGFHVWEKEIEIEPERVTRLEPVVLLPDRPVDEIISKSTFRDLVPIHFDYKIFAWKTDFLSSLTKIDLFFGREIPVGRKLAEKQDFRVVRTHTRAGSDTVVLEAERGGRRGYAVIDLEREKNEGFWEFPEAADLIAWDPKRDNTIYFLIKGRLWSVEAGTPAPKGPLAENVKGFGVKHGKLFLLRNDNTFVTANSEGGGEEPAGEDLFMREKILGRTEASFFTIEILKRDLFQKDLVLFLSDSGTLLSNWVPYYLAGDRVAGFKAALHSETEKFLYWTPQRIGAVELERGEADAPEKLPEPSVLYAGGREIRDAYWAYDDTHILFMDGDRVFLLEAVGPAPYLAQEIVRPAPQTRMLYHEPSTALYFIEGSHRRLMRRKLVD